ncbi:MAG: carboxyltransferase domain-containing protein, partial [Chitinophagaceae bacterium]
MQPVSSYQIFPLGDSAITLDLGNVINEAVNRKVTALFHHLQKKPFDGMIEAIPAYSSLSIYFDVISLKKKVKEKTVYEWLKQELEKILN